jgi:hypothetical protein
VTSRRDLAGTLIIAASFLLIGALGESDASELRGGSAAASVVDGNGNLHVPINYRREYEYLGSWAVADGQSQGSKEIHVVYASRGAAGAYKADGHFADGTVLVKEVFQAATASMSTGTVSHVDVLKGWFVMVRDPAGRHVGNRIWGDGWGWSWFDAGNPTKTTSTDYATNCRGCHVPAQATEWVYVGGYPSLRTEGVR